MEIIYCLQCEMGKVSYSNLFHSARVKLTWKLQLGDETLMIKLNWKAFNFDAWTKAGKIELFSLSSFHESLNIFFDKFLIKKFNKKNPKNSSSKTFFFRRPFFSFIIFMLHHQHREKRNLTKSLNKRIFRSQMLPLS